MKKKNSVWKLSAPDGRPDLDRQNAVGNRRVPIDYCLHYRCIQNPQNPYLKPPILVYDATDFDKSAGF